MFLNSFITVLCIVPGLLSILLASGCNVNCPVNSGTRCIGGDSCSNFYASCDGGYCRCHKSALHDGCSCLPHVSGCLIKRSPSTYVGKPYTDGRLESPYYGCVSTATNCEYEVHVIANYESSNGIPRVASDTYVIVLINGQSTKPLILVFTSYEPINWRLSLPSGVAVNRILLSGPSRIYGHSNTNVENVSLDSGYGPDEGEGDTPGNIVYLTEKFGPISSFSGSRRTDEWIVIINRSPACNSSIPTNDNPQPIVIRFKKESYTINENEGHVTVSLLTNGPTLRNITVQYSTIDGTAQAPMDYTAINETRVIPAGSTQFNITIPIHFDLVDEQSEYFKVHLSLPDEPTVCIPDTTVNISNVKIAVKNSIPWPGIIGGVIGGIIVLSLALLAVVIAVRILYTGSRARVTMQNNTAPSESNSTNLSSTQPHPPPLPTTAAFNLPRPEPPESVVITIGKPQTCLSITQAPPPAYNLHETFTTCNEGKKLSEAPPPYLQPPPTYDTATQETD